MAHEIVMLNSARVLGTSVRPDGTAFTPEIQAKIAKLRTYFRETGVLNAPPTMDALKPYNGLAIDTERLDSLYRKDREFVDPSMRFFNDGASLYRGVLLGDLLVARLVSGDMVLGGGMSTSQGVNLTAQPDAAAFFAHKLSTDPSRKRDGATYIAEVLGLTAQEVENSALMTPLVLRYTKETLGDRVRWVKSYVVTGMPYVLSADFYDCTPPPTISQSTPEGLEQIRQITGFDYSQKDLRIA